MDEGRRQTVDGRRETGDGSPAKSRAGRSVSNYRLPSAVCRLSLAFLLGGWVLPHLKIEWRGGPEAADAVRAAPARPPLPLPAVDEPIARAAAAVSPAVVNIDTVSRVTVGTGDPFFDEVFGRRTVQR